MGTTNVSMDIYVPLPCGCMLQHRYMYEGPVPVEKHEQVIDFGASVLKYWLQNRTSRHDCSLVSESNPSGAKPVEPVSCP